MPPLSSLGARALSCRPGTYTHDPSRADAAPCPLRPTSIRLRFPAGAWCDGQQEAGPQTSTSRKGLGTGSHSCQVTGRPASQLPTVNMAGPHHGTQGGRGGPVACFRSPGWPGVSDTCPHVGTALEREATRPWGWWPSLSSGPKAPGRTLVCACCRQLPPAGATQPALPGAGRLGTASRLPATANEGEAVTTALTPQTHALAPLRR